MKCFEVTERSTRGLRVARFPEAHVPIQGSARLDLDAKLTDFIRQIPKELKGDLLLYKANVMLAGRTLHLAPEPPKWGDTKALVRVTTQTAKGALSVTADCWTEKEQNGRVERLWLPFPPPGVKVVLGSAEPVPVDAGAFALELFVVMEEGASFRITRTGDLQGASPEIFVRWYGDRLITRVPNRFRDMHEAKGAKASIFQQPPSQRRRGRRA